MIGRREKMVMGAALVLRAGLILYGRWQDVHMEVPYTDIDYKVYSDASEYMSRGESPYMRSTYRYTPILAGLLVPNWWWFPEYGKVLFSLADVVAAWCACC